MGHITKQSAKGHCRTCLTKLNDEHAEIKSDQHPLSDESSIKFISVNSPENKNVFKLIECYIEKEAMIVIDSQYYPQNICLSCYNILNNFDEFHNQALESVATLRSLFAEGGFARVELNDDQRYCNQTINNMLDKDVLMETETVVLDENTDISFVSNEICTPDPFSAKKLRKIAVKKVGRVRKKTQTPKVVKETECYETEHDNHWMKCDTNSWNSSSSVEDDAPLSQWQKMKTRSVSFKNQSYGRLAKNQIEPVSKNTKLRTRKSTKKTYRCDMCNHIFSYKLTRDAHIRKVHEGSKRPYQCDRCDKTYTSCLALTMHINTIHEAYVRSYPCEYPGCCRSYKSQNALQKHKRDKHVGRNRKKRYLCDLCGGTFTNLKYHLSNQHQIGNSERSKEEHICNICNKQFHSHYSLKYHVLQVHSSDREFECNVCGKRLAKKFMLAQHMRIHSVNFLPCYLCDKQFKLKNKLQSHIRAVHLKLKPYSCRYCSQMFAKSNTLRHHEYIHTGEKPYVCDICGQGYRQNNTLKTHKKSHAAMKPEMLPTKKC